MIYFDIYEKIIKAIILFKARVKRKRSKKVNKIKAKS